MRLFKKFIVLSLITVVALYAIFFYINKYILSTDNIKIRSQKVNTTNINTNIYINIPQAAENIKVSYDGSYVAYEENQNFTIIATKSGLKKVLNLDYNVSFYNWLPDRNRILIVGALKKNYNRTFKLDYYDADRDEIGNISVFNAFDTTTQIKDLKVSTITNSIYIKAGDNKGRVKIYYLDIMKKLKKVKTKDNNIGNIEAIPNKSSIAYEDSNNGKIYVTNIGKPLVIDNVISQSLLGIDNLDNVYIGEGTNKKIIKIYSGSLDAANITWYPHELIAPVDRTDIFISKAGGIYVNIILENKLYSVKSQEYKNYPGKLLQVIDNAIISINQGKLIITKLNGI